MVDPRPLANGPEAEIEIGHAPDPDTVSVFGDSLVTSGDRQPKRIVTMKIQVNTDTSVEGSDALTQTVETTVHAALDRYGERLTRVEAHLSDEGGTMGEDGRGKRCLLEARPAGMDPVVVTGSADTVERACHDATQKMQSLLDSTFGRIDSRDADATIRQSRP